MRPTRRGASLLLALLAGCATTGGRSGQGDLADGSGRGSEADAAFNQAMGLLDAGQFARAGAAFEEFAAANPASASVPLALFDAALAYEKANQFEKAAALREQLMNRFPDSREAEAAQPSLAALRARQGKNDEAVRLYRGFIDRFPGSPYRCSAVFNLGQALDQLRKATDAAASYLAYGTDARCAREAPNAAANVLFRAGELFDRAGQRDDAKKAYQACADLAGVTDTGWKANQKEARQRAKR